MNLLIPYFIFTLSFFPIAKDPAEKWHDNLYETDITIGAELFDVLHIEGQVKTDMQKITWYAYAPYQDEFYIRAYLNWKGFSLGIEHLCSHPIETTNEIWQYDGGHNKIYFKFDSRDFRRH